MLHAMVSSGPAAGHELMLWNAGLSSMTGVFACAALGAVAVFAPNSNAVGEKLHAWCRQAPEWRGLIFGFALTIVAFLIVLNESRDSVSAFIYFNF
jgi:hypothetical protein